MGKFALLIGIGNYNDKKLETLKAPKEDVKMLISVLNTPDMGGFERKNIQTLIDCTYAKAHQSLGSFLKDKKKDDLVLVYFSGHGLLDSSNLDSPYLALKNTSTKNLSGSAESIKFINEEMKKCKAGQKILILDSCYSGLFSGAKGVRNIPAITEKTFANKDSKGYTILTATSDTIALDAKENLVNAKNSLFTHFLIEGIMSGSADQNLDGYISINDIYKYTYEKVQEINPEQKPKIFAEQQGDILIARNPNLESLKVYSELRGLISQYKSHLPQETIPRIMIAGKTGNGKTTTINSLFGKRVGEIGHDKRGTTKDESYIWKYSDQNIELIDLPGLGESESQDRTYLDLYRKWSRDVHGFIVVINPPRPAEDGTLKTVKAILDNGVSSSQLVFGFNKISTLNFDDPKTNITRRIIFSRKRGIFGKQSYNAVNDAKLAFLKNIQNEFPRHNFELHQIIEYDALTGWNIYKLLTAVVQILPYRALGYFERATREARQTLIANAQDEEEKKRLQDEEKQFGKTISKNMLDGLENTLSKINPSLGNSFHEVRPKIEEKLSSVINTGKNFFNAIGNFFKR